MIDESIAAVRQIHEARAKVQEEAIRKAVDRDLPAFMQKMTMGHEPNAHELRGALFALGLIADRNTTEFETRLRYRERSWLWRMFHRQQKPKRA